MDSKRTSLWWASLSASFLRLRVASGLAVVLALALMPQAAVSEPQVADGYKIKQNCPNIDVASLGVPATWTPGQIAFSKDGNKLFITYTTIGDGQVHVRDLKRCTQEVLIADIDTPLGIAVHPHTGKLYITHRYLNPEYTSADPLYKKYRSAVSIFDSRNGSLVVDKWVKGFAPSIFAGVPVSGEVGNGLQGLTFDHQGNLYVVCNIDVWETVSDPPNFYATGPLYKVNRYGEVSVFATGLRASLDLVIAETNNHGEATAFYAGDNGEGLFCVASGNGCAERLVPGSTPPVAITRQYYDELNYVVKGGHYGYPESAPTAPFDVAKNVTHIGPLWNFDRVPGAGFVPGTPGWSVPTGIALLNGYWGKAKHSGKVKDPLFLTFWLGRRLDMFTGPNRSQRTTLVSNLAGRGMDVVVRSHDNEVFFMEDETRSIWTIQPKK
jgi:hypothetical protein